MPGIFVFGSNEAGRHGKGVGVGRTGNAYAIPTKGGRLRTLPLARIRQYVEEFLAYAPGQPGPCLQGDRHRPGSRRVPA
jgi:hypothetical protein